MKTRCFNLRSLLVIFGVHLNLEIVTVFWEVKLRPRSFLKTPQVILQCSQHWCTDEGTVRQAWTPLGASKERNVVWRIRVHNSHGRAESGDQGKLLLLPQEVQKPRESTPEAWWGLCATECGLEAALAYGQLSFLLKPFGLEALHARDMMTSPQFHLLIVTVPIKCCLTGAAMTRDWRGSTERKMMPVCG